MKRLGLETHEGIAETAVMIVTSTHCEASRSQAVAENKQAWAEKKGSFSSSCNAYLVL